MTFLVETVTQGLAKVATTAAPVAIKPVAATLPKLATESIATGVKALAEPVAKTAETVAEKATAPVFEAATKPIGELGKGISGPITARVLETIPHEARLPLLERGFFTKKLVTETGAHAPLLTPNEMKALGNIAGIDLPQDVLENPAFARSFSDALQNRLLTGDKEHFSLEQTVLKSLRDVMNGQKEAEDLEKLKRQAIRDAIKNRLNAYRQSILADRRLYDDERSEALRKVDRLEAKLNLAADIRMIFGKNFVTTTIESFLADPKTA